MTQFPCPCLCLLLSLSAFAALQNIPDKPFFDESQISPEMGKGQEPNRSIIQESKASWCSGTPENLIVFYLTIKLFFPYFFFSLSFFLFLVPKACLLCTHQFIDLTHKRIRKDKLTLLVKSSSLFQLIYSFLWNGLVRPSLFGLFFFLFLKKQNQCNFQAPFFFLIKHLFSFSRKNQAFSKRSNKETIARLYFSPFV